MGKWAEAAKIRKAELDAERDGMKTDIAKLLAGLDKVWNVLPVAVKTILTKYKA